MIKPEDLHNKYAGRKGFIIATGPSLAYRNMDFLEGEVTIGVNLSPLLFDQWGLCPSFNVVADKYVYPRFAPVLKNLTAGPTINVIVASACDTFPHDCTTENTLLAPIKARQFEIGDDPSTPPNFSKQPFTHGFARAKTVVYDAVQLAYYLGLKETYILGMDFTTNHSWGKDGHAYEIQIHPNYPSLTFPGSDSVEIQRGLPGNPLYANIIETHMSHARKIFEEDGRTLIADDRTCLSSLQRTDVLRTFGYVPKIVAFVPCKGTSSRIPGKNTKLLGEKPLFLHLLDTLLECRTIDEVCLDSESEDVFKLARDRKHKELRRPVHLADNATDGNQLLLYESSQTPDADIVVQALPTAPFLSRRTVDGLVYGLIRDKNADSSFGVSKQKIYRWNKNGTPANYDPLHIPNSNILDETIIETMSIYAIRRESLLRGKCRIGIRPIMHDIRGVETIDINTPEDFRVAEMIERGLRHG